LLAYQGTDSNGVEQIYLRHLAGGTPELVSRNQGGTGGGNGDSRAPVLTSDGRYVVFLSAASDLVAGDDNNREDLFLYDAVPQTMLCLTPGSELFPPGLNPTSRPILGADGRTVVFQSFAAGIVPGDFNQTGDVFYLRLGDTDSDQDGLDDSWEWTFFNGLERDGTGDFDGDGQTDETEFRAGTNPADDASILSVLRLTRAGDGAVTLLWSAVPGKTYQVQVRYALGIPGWLDEPGTVTAISGTASLVHQSGALAEQAFYRVVVLP